MKLEFQREKYIGFQSSHNRIKVWSKATEINRSISTELALDQAPDAESKKSKLLYLYSLHMQK